MTEPAIDLGICFAIISSAKGDRDPDSDGVWVKLSGGRGSCSEYGRTACREAKKLGFETVIS